MTTPTDDLDPDRAVTTALPEGDADPSTDEFRPDRTKPTSHRAPRWPWLVQHRRRIRRGVILFVVVVLALPAWSLGSALLRPGSDAFTERMAEWARDHGLSGVVTWAENQRYESNPPKVGGALSDADRSAMEAGGSPSEALGGPPDIEPVIAPAIPGEGVWRVLSAVNGRPAVLKAELRPDPTHTSYLASVVWMSTKAVRFVLHPGSEEPGPGPWTEPNTIPPGKRTNLVATFNGGFRLKDALPGTFGGYYADGRTVGRLQDGAAAEIFFRDGSMTIGEWGRDAHLGDPAIVAVRENLHLLVDNGSIQASIADGSSKIWGYTINNSYYVWRSGVGVTADGNIVFALGPTLSVQTLADLLRRAGAVRAMELDINPDWVYFMSYDPSKDPANPAPAKLMNFPRPADRYYQSQSRDFVAVHLR